MSRSDSAQSAGLAEEVERGLPEAAGVVWVESIGGDDPGEVGDFAGAVVNLDRLVAGGMDGRGPAKEPEWGRPA
jgi:hypothetical protein